MSSERHSMIIIPYGACTNNICTVRECNKISDIPYGVCVFLMIKISNNICTVESVIKYPIFLIVRAYSS